MLSLVWLYVRDCILIYLPRKQVFLALALKSDFIHIFDIMFPISRNRYIPNLYISISIYFLCLQPLPVSNFVIHIYKIYISKYMKYVSKYMK